MKVLAVVPARGGSKGLPGKNIKPLLDKPLIAWSIEQGLSCRYVDEVIVSTDDEKIAEIARQYGGIVPFIRPANLAKDTTPTADVLLHLIEEMEKRGQIYDYLLLLEPTSPLREVSDLDAAFMRLINTHNASSIVGVSAVESQHPEFCVKINEEGFIQSKNDFKVMRRQEIDELYFYEGSLYLSKMETFKVKRNFYHEGTLAYVMPKWKSYEIDDIVDFIITEAILKNLDKIKRH